MRINGTYIVYLRMGHSDFSMICLRMTLIYILFSNYAFKSSINDDMNNTIQ